MKTGFARICINPPLGTPISGYYSARFVKGVLDDLYVAAIAFDDGIKKAVVIAVDQLMLSIDICKSYREKIAEFCNLPLEAVFVTCSHTHTGPMIGQDFASELQGNPLYDEYVGICMRDVAKTALENVCESKFYVAEGEAKGISFVRRFKMKDGSVCTNPGVENPDIDYPLGEPNETVKLLKIERENSKDIFIVNFGVHPDTIGGEYISADYPGFVRSTIEAAIADTNCVFLLAPQGDVNHINVKPGKYRTNSHNYEHSKHMGRVIAGEVLKICGTAEKIEIDELGYSLKTVICSSNQENDKIEESKRLIEIHESGKGDELIPQKGMEYTTVIAEAQRILELENGPDSFTFTLSAIKIGNIAFAGIPGEPFTEIANRIYDASPFDTTILCCLTNGGDSYFPTSAAYDEGGYEARTSRLKKGADNIIVHGMTELLNELRR